MKFVIFVFTIVLFLGCYDANKLVDKIVANDLLEAEYVGFAPKKSKEYERFQKLKENATDNELRALKGHPHPIVRTYAIISLIERTPENLISLFKEALKNNESFSSVNGDVFVNSDVCTKIYFYCSRDRSALHKQIGALDSIIITEIDTSHLLLYFALNDKVYDSKFNSRIVKLALDGNSADAIFYLDKFKVKADTIELKQSIKNILDSDALGLSRANQLRGIRSKLKRINGAIELEAKMRE